MKRYLSALPVNLEKELDRLYGLPLERFTAEREARVKELRSGGDPEAANRLKKARKPTVAAWAANQLARSERMNVRALLTAGEQLRAGQAELMRGGKADELRRAQESERRALAALVDAGREIAEGDATLRKLETTLRAAAVDPEARELLEQGRLTNDLTPSGFGFAGMPAPRRRRSRSSTAGKAEAEAADRRRRELAEARSALQELREHSRAAEREADAARKELARAEEHLRALERSKK